MSIFYQARVPFSPPADVKETKITTAWHFFAKTRMSNVDR